MWRESVLSGEEMILWILRWIVVLRAVGLGCPSLLFYFAFTEVCMVLIEVHS